MKKEDIYGSAMTFRDRTRLLSHPRIKALTMLTGEVSMEDVTQEVPLSQRVHPFFGSGLSAMHHAFKKGAAIASARAHAQAY